MAIKGALGRALAPHVQRAAPEWSAGFVREALTRAIHGVGPLPGAVPTAQKRLREHGGDVDAAIRQLIETNVRYSGAQGLVTNVGGLVTVAVTIPTNVAGLAVLQCRMVAGIAHLRGYDLTDPRVRNAVLACLVGEDEVRSLVRQQKLPAPPMGLATAPVHDPHLDQVVSAEVTRALITKVAGKRIATTVGRRVPVLGGVIGGGTDALATWQVGRYAARELRARRLASGET